VRAATKYRKCGVRIYQSFVLLGLSWVVLLPYYELQKGQTAEMLPAVSSFLQVVIGHLLWDEADVRQSSSTKGREHTRGGSNFKPWPAVLLIVLAVPALLDPTSGKLLKEEMNPDVRVVVGFFLSVLAFWTIVRAFRRLNRDDSWTAILVIAAIYTVLEGWFATWYIIRSHPTENMPPALEISFAVTKLLFTCGIVLLAGRDLPNKRRRFRESWRDLL